MHADRPPAPYLNPSGRILFAVETGIHPAMSRLLAHSARILLSSAPLNSMLVQKARGKSMSAENSRL
jgi:hypothetical protein